MAGSVGAGFEAVRPSDFVLLLVVGCTASAGVGCGLGWLGFDTFGIFGNCADTVCKVQTVQTKSARVSNKILFIFLLLNAGLNRQLVVNERVILQFKNRHTFSGLR